MFYMQVRKKQRRRRHVIIELLKTEHAYIGWLWTKKHNLLFWTLLKTLLTNSQGHLSAVESKYRIPLKTTTVQDFEFSPVSTPVGKGIPEYKRSGGSSTPSSQHRSKNGNGFCWWSIIFSGKIPYFLAHWFACLLLFICISNNIRATHILSEDCTHSKYYEKKRHHWGANEGLHSSNSMVIAYCAEHTRRCRHRPRQTRPKTHQCDSVQIIHMTVCPVIGSYIPHHSFPGACSHDNLKTYSISPAEARTQVCNNVVW